MGLLKTASGSGVRLIRVLIVVRKSDTCILDHQTVAEEIEFNSMRSSVVISYRGGGVYRVCNVEGPPYSNEDLQDVQMRIQRYSLI